MDDPLIQPTVRDGLMDPLPDLPGFGRSSTRPGSRPGGQVTDPDGLLDDL